MKSDQMKEAMAKIFPEQAKRIEEKVCPFCSLPQSEMKFRDNLSKREFAISGLCQECQDGVFG